MIDRIFLSHPRTVGESYLEHLGVAGRFGVEMILGGAKALIHAVLPNVYETAASDTIGRLHQIMVKKRGARRDANAEMMTVDWVI